MQINTLRRNNPNFTGVLNNKLLLKSLEKVSEHGTSFAAGTSLVMSLTVRPLAIFATPNVEKENKQYASASSIGSGLIKFGMVEAIALPIENAVKKIDRNAEKYLKPATIKNLRDSSNTLTDSKSYKLATQILKLGAGLITAIPKSLLTIAFIPFIMDKIFNLQITHVNKEAAPQSNRKHAPLSFTGRFNEEIPKTIGKILDIQSFQDFVKKHRNQDKNIAKHMTAATDILLTGSFAISTNRSKKIKEDRKKALIYNNIISTGITLAGGYSIDRLIKNKTANFIEKFSKINAGDPKLYKYIEGINILRPAVIFAGIYYGILPMLSIYLAERTDKIASNK